jgi:hypothetical protein
VCGIAIAAALGFAPPANAQTPKDTPQTPKVSGAKAGTKVESAKKVTPQTPKVSGAKAGTKVGGRHEGHNTPQTPTVTPQTVTQTPTVTQPTTVIPTITNLQTPSVALQPKPTTGTQPIDLQGAKALTPYAIQHVNPDGTVTTVTNPQSTVTLHPNGPQTVTPPTVTQTPTATPQVNTQRTNTGGMGPEWGSH